MKKISFSGTQNQYEVIVLNDNDTYSRQYLEALNARGYTGVTVEDSEKTVWEMVNEESPVVYMLSKGDSRNENFIPIAGGVRLADVEAFQKALRFISASPSVYRISNQTLPA